jgi:hypothetical protein
MYVRRELRVSISATKEGRSCCSVQLIEYAANMMIIRLLIDSTDKSAFNSAVELRWLGMEWSGTIWLNLRNSGHSKPRLLIWIKFYISSGIMFKQILKFRVHKVVLPIQKWANLEVVTINGTCKKSKFKEIPPGEYKNPIFCFTPLMILRPRTVDL